MAQGDGHEETVALHVLLFQVFVLELEMYLLLSRKYSFFYTFLYPELLVNSFVWVI